MEWVDISETNNTSVETLVNKFDKKQLASFVRKYAKDMAEAEDRANKAEAIAKEAKAIAEEAVSNNASPCGYLDVWQPKTIQDENEKPKTIHQATLRQELTVELLEEMLQNAKDNGGISGYEFSFQTCKLTNNAQASFQVYPSYVMPYKLANAKKEKDGVKYRNRQFSKLANGRQVFIPKAEKEAIAV